MEIKSEDISTDLSHTNLLDTFGRIGDAILACDLNWNFTYINEAGYKLLKYQSNDSLVGKNFWKEIKIKKNSGLYKELHRAMESQECKVIEKHFSSIGSCYSIRLFPSQTGLTLIVTDMTAKYKEGIKTKDCFNELNYITQLILDSVTEGIYSIDKNGKVLLWNEAAERMTGYTKEELMNKSIHKLIHHTNIRGEELPVEKCPIALSLNNGTSIYVDHDIYWRKDGTSFLVEYTTNPIKRDDDYVGLVITFRDITMRKETEVLLRESDKLSAVGEFAAGIAHEIRNPLTSLKGFLHLIESGMEAKKAYFDIMNSEFNRIEQILTELLLLAKPQSTMVRSHHLQMIVENVIMLLETQSIMKNIIIETNISSEPIYMLCVENQMKQLFINLIKNAIEAMDNGGKIIVTVVKKGDHACISVADEGCGIPIDKLDKIREPFYTTKETGTGLGLLVTYNIVEEHKGSIHVDSVVNEGTTFTVTLPIK